MKKSTTIRLGCLVMALAVLSGALMVAAFSGSPYETLKNALLETAVAKNATMEMTAKLLVNGEVQENSKSYAASADTAYYTKNFDQFGRESGFRYNSGKLSLNSSYTAEDGTQWYEGRIPESEIDYGNQRTASSILGLSLTREDLESASVRFGLLAMDALVGDLKNNVIMSSEDGVRRISGTLTSAQMPEIVRAGIDMITETSLSGGSHYSERVLDINYAAGTRTVEQTRLFGEEKTVTVYDETFEPFDTVNGDASKYHNNGKEFYGFFYEYPSGGEEKSYAILTRENAREYTEVATRADYGDEDIFNIPMKKLDVTYVHGDAEVDANGMLTYVNVRGNATVTDIFGEVNEVEIFVECKITNIGATSLDCPLPGADNELTPRLIENAVGNPYSFFYFTLNPDGSVNRNSITTTWPGELEYRNVKDSGIIRSVRTFETTDSAVSVEVTTDESDETEPEETETNENGDILP